MAREEGTSLPVRMAGKMEPAQGSNAPRSPSTPVPDGPPLDTPPPDRRAKSMEGRLASKARSPGPASGAAVARAPQPFAANTRVQQPTQPAALESAPHADRSGSSVLASDVCRVPYTVDSSGVRHVKLECM
jgi:hypothetical protein